MFQLGHIFRTRKFNFVSRNIIKNGSFSDIQWASHSSSFSVVSGTIKTQAKCRVLVRSVDDNIPVECGAIAQNVR